MPRSVRLPRFSPCFRVRVGEGHALLERRTERVVVLGVAREPELVDEGGPLRVRRRRRPRGLLAVASSATAPDRRPTSGSPARGRRRAAGTPRSMRAIEGPADAIGLLRGGEGRDRLLRVDLLVDRRVRLKPQERLEVRARLLRVARGSPRTRPGRTPRAPRAASWYFSLAGLAASTSITSRVTRASLQDPALTCSLTFAKSSGIDWAPSDAGGENQGQKATAARFMRLASAIPASPSPRSASSGCPSRAGGRTSRSPSS